MPRPLRNRLPGIVVTIEPDVGIIGPAGFERFPCIVGYGDIEIPKERALAITRNATASGSWKTATQDALTESVATVYQSGRSPGLTHYRQPTDFVVVDGEDADGNPISLIDWADGSTVPDADAVYYVSYTVQMPSTAFEPTLYLDEDLLVRERGAEVIFSDENEINPLVTASRLAFAQGAPGVIVTQLDFLGFNSPSDEDAAWENPLDPNGADMATAYSIAIGKVDKIEEFKLFLVPLDPSTNPSDSTKNFPGGADQNARWHDHAILASDPEEGRERTLLAAIPIGTTLDGLRNIAQAYKDTGGGQRFVVPGVKGRNSDEASSVSISIESVNGAVVPTTFLNAIMAGLLTGSPIGAPNNNAPVSNVALFDDWTIPEARVLRGDGVVPYKTRSGRVRMVIPITSDTTNAFTEDLSLQDIADYLRAFIRVKLFDQFRNVNITGDTEGAIVAALSSLLNGLVLDQILVGFTGIQANQRTDEPRKIDVRGKAKPAFPLRWIDVDLEFTATI